MNYKQIAFAQDFASFLIEKLGNDAEKINQIILYGSAARGESKKNSDIDIFIDVSDEKAEKEILEINEKFYSSVKVTKYWNLLGIKNEIHCNIGKLSEWKDLEKSIISNGILLYGRYNANIETYPYYLFIVTPTKKRNKNISVWRTLYGYSQKVGKKKYTKKGLITENNGKKLAKGVFIIPAEKINNITSYISKNNFKYRILQFFMDRDYC